MRYSPDFSLRIMRPPQRRRERLRPLTCRIGAGHHLLKSQSAADLLVPWRASRVPYRATNRSLPAVLVACMAFINAPAAQTNRVRARDLGIVAGTLPPGPLNGITDVAGVLVGHATIVQGSGGLKVGEGPVRTGVTAV